MPYIASKERPPIDEKVAVLAEEISDALSRGANSDTELSVYYRHTFVTVGKALLQLARGTAGECSPGPAAELAAGVFGEAGGASGRGAWLGRLNYALTRLIQVVPERMVERGVWKEEFRYWLYAQTVGALAKSAIELGALGDDWAVDGLVGVLTDVKDEYKRRVNAAYEAIQIVRAGDCYTTRYRTELSEVKDPSGAVVGYSEIMKDLGGRR